MIAKRHLLTLGAGMVAAGAGVWLANRRGAGALAPLPQGLDALWQLTLRSPDGTELALSALKGKPLLINFWATWCAPCIEEMPLLDQFFRQQAGNGIQMLGIAADKAAAVAAFLAKFPVSFSIVLAGFDGISLSKSLGNETGGLPYTILIDAKEAILFAKKGQLTTDDLKIISSLIM